MELAAERLLLGEGSSPEVAWDHAVQKAHGEAKEKLPKTMIRQLSAGWALERFGLTSIRVLHAVEVGDYRVCFLQRHVFRCGAVVEEADTT